MNAPVTGCPVQHSKGPDDRKSAALADAKLTTLHGARKIGRFGAARDILRSPKVRQYGATSDMVDLSKPDEISFFFLDGD
jgi:hypothetical protein